MYPVFWIAYLEENVHVPFGNMINMINVQLGGERKTYLLLCLL